MTKEAFCAKVTGKLIVSCQALPDEPLHSSYIMSRMAYAAMEGGAAGIRANTAEDIQAIKNTVDLPVIGIIKREFPDSPIYITPALEDVDALVSCGADVIALDATDRLRPNGEALDAFFTRVRTAYPEMLFMADCSSYEEGIHAARIGFDFVGTTLCGYTPYTKGTPIPNITLISELAKNAGVPIIGEGGIWTPEQLKMVLDAGAMTAVVGTAITRPREITKHFVQAIS